MRKTDNRRGRFLTLEEVSRLGEAFNQVEAGGANPKAVAIVRLWALTGCRRNEIAELQVHEVKLDESLFEFDDTKTGKSVRPFGPAAAALLAELLKDRGSGYVFPAETGKGFYQSTRKVWAEVTKIAKLPDVTPHTLRHTLGSTATSSGEALALTRAILSYANLRSTAIYAHVQRDPSLEAAKRVEKVLAAALQGKAAQSKDGDSADGVPEAEADLIRVLAERFSKEGSDAARLRAIIAQVVALNT